MYENVLYQDDVVNRLKMDVNSSSLNIACLFSGPVMSGKLTAALETARVLSCLEHGDWNCHCKMCFQHRALAHQRTIITGYRDLRPEIAVAAEVLQQYPTQATCYLFIRSVQKLLRRFDSVLWEGEEKKLAPVFKDMENLSESLELLSPDKSIPQGTKLKALLSLVQKNCQLIQKKLYGFLPVFQVRLIANWASHSVGQDHKTVIIENADHMQVAAANALLKFLEEPPPDTSIILLTGRKTMLMPTVVSRVRNYPFRQRNNFEENKILERVYREKDAYPSLKEYFQTKGKKSSEKMLKLIGEFVESAKIGEGYPSSMSQISEQADFTAFIEALINDLQQQSKQDIEKTGGNIRAGKVILNSLEAVRLIHETAFNTGTLNIPIQISLKKLFYQLGLMA